MEIAENHPENLLLMVKILANSGLDGARAADAILNVDCMHVGAVIDLLMHFKREETLRLRDELIKLSICKKKNDGPEALRASLISSLAMSIGHRISFPLSMSWIPNRPRRETENPNSNASTAPIKADPAP